MAGKGGRYNIEVKDKEKEQKISELTKEIREKTREMLRLLDSMPFDEKLNATPMVERLKELEKEQGDLMDEILLG